MCGGNFGYAGIVNGSQYGEIQQRNAAYKYGTPCGVDGRLNPELREKETAQQKNAAYKGCRNSGKKIADFLHIKYTSFY